MMSRKDVVLRFQTAVGTYEIPQPFIRLFLIARCLWECWEDDDLFPAIERIDWAPHGPIDEVEPTKYIA